jgi:methyl-accepting chemotaxis protein
VDEQATTTREISRNVSEAASGSNAIALSSSHGVDGRSHSGSAATELAKMANELRVLVDPFTY